MGSDTILTLAEKFGSTVELQLYCDTQYKTILSLNEQILTLKGEIAHMKELLHSKVERLEVSPEQAICEIQIRRLLESTSMRELTLEETKRLDLLVKNLYLAKGQNAALVADFTKSPLSEEALLLLVEAPDSGES